MMNGTGVRSDHTEFGSWLPIHDAARKLGILELLAYRLMSEGKLRSRQHDSGTIEVWVADTDPLTQAPTPPGDASYNGRYVALAERLASAIHHQVELLTNSLVSAYDRNAQLARENGALTERLEGFERKLKSLHDVQERLDAIEAANKQLTHLLSICMEVQSPPKRRRWPWLPGVSILLLLFLLSLSLVVLFRPAIDAFGATSDQSGTVKRNLLDDVFYCPVDKAYSQNLHASSTSTATTAVTMLKISTAVHPQCHSQETFSTTGVSGFDAPARRTRISV